MNCEFSTIDSSAYLRKLQKSLYPLRKQLTNHKVYASIKTQEQLMIFMEHHVFAVWDFMSLLKYLQHHLTCVAVPWVPQGYQSSRRFINEIVLAEESDFFSGIGYISHFELYRTAMKHSQADTTRLDHFLELVSQGESVSKALEQARVPRAAQAFVRTTWQFIESNSIHSIAVAFTLGREEVIPDMFKSFVNALRDQFPNHLTIFYDYLSRHISLDEEHHTPMAMQMLEELCGADHTKWQEVEEAAYTALNARITLWDGVLGQIENVSNNQSTF